MESISQSNFNCIDVFHTFAFYINIIINERSTIHHKDYEYKYEWCYNNQNLNQLGNNIPYHDCDPFLKYLKHCCIKKLIYLHEFW